MDGCEGAACGDVQVDHGGGMCGDSGGMNMVCVLNNREDVAVTLMI